MVWHWMDVSVNGSNETIHCNSYPRDNSTILNLYEGYMGIPQNLLINAIAWLLLLLLFAILRKKAWNYGRIALVQRNEQRELLQRHGNYNVFYFLQILFLNVSCNIIFIAVGIFHPLAIYFCTRWTQLFYGDVEGGSLTFQTAPNRNSLDSSEVSVLVDQGFFAWITAIFRVRDVQILKRSGPDALQYLTFQRYLIAYVALLTCISLIIILPVNFQGELEGEDNSSFGRTTISNLDPTSLYLWIHVILCILLLPIGIIFMRHFSVNIKFEEHATISRTIIFWDIPKDKCTKSLLIQHFQEAYPGIVIQDIQLAYNIKELIEMDKKREAIYAAKSWSEAYFKENGKRLLIYPCRCSWAISCCGGCGCSKEDAITYYSQQEVALLAAVDQEKNLSMEKPLGICFITFDSEETAYKVYKDHQHTCKCGVNPPSSSVSSQLEPYRWGTASAPNPSDIYWENLSSNSEHWFLRAFCVNFFIFFILFFLTTPFVVINSLDRLNIVDSINKLNPLLGRFLPTLLLWTVAALMPILVSYSDQFVNHWTRSVENHTVMRKTFIFLLIMIIILPSLGLASAKAFLEWVLVPKGQTMRWECVFLPDNGAFYVNYVITSSFVGTALELIRFPELIMYIVRLCATRSVAEQQGVRKAILWEFPFGAQYAWFLLIFATTVIYSISCPLITPFGLIYMCFKHCVDRHNIIFAYGPSKISRNIHVTAINFVVFSILLLQMMLLFFTFIRRGWAAITIFSITFFCLSSTFFIGQIFFNLFKGFSPILYTRFKDEDLDGTQASEVPESASDDIKFLPNVLSRRKRDIHGNEDAADGRNCTSPTSRTYGTNEDGLLEEECGRVTETDRDRNGTSVDALRSLYQDYEPTRPSNSGRGENSAQVQVPEFSTSRGGAEASSQPI